MFTLGISRRVALQLLPEVVVPKPKPMTRVGMEGWQDPKEWKMEGDHYRRSCGEFSLFGSSAPRPPTSSRSPGFNMHPSVQGAMLVEASSDGVVQRRRKGDAWMVFDASKYASLSSRSPRPPRALRRPCPGGPCWTRRRASDRGNRAARESGSSG